MHIVREGTVDGQPAKVVVYPARRQTHVYWGGMEKPDGIGHNHAVVQNSNPDAFHYLRVGGELIVDQSLNPTNSGHRRRQAGFTIAMILRDSLRRALRYWSQGGR